MKNKGRNNRPFWLALVTLVVLFPVNAFAAIPAESSHSNTNTGTNLNTLTNTGNIAFSIAYNASGDIKWYKDNVLVQTNYSVAAASITTAWTAGDYGKVKQMKVNSTNASGTSVDTIWNVEVQRTGTATISLHEPYVDPTVDFMDTMWVADNGWSNLPSLYLHFKDNSLLEYAGAKTYILKMPIYVNGGTFYITTDTAKTVYMRGLPQVSGVSDYVTKIFVAGNGKMKIDKVNIYGWNLTTDTELDNSACLRSPAIVSTESNEMDITNCNFRHVLVYYEEDMTADDLVDNNSFYLGDPYNMNLVSGDSTNVSDGQTVSNNYFFTDLGFNIQGNTHTRDLSSPHSLFLNNKFIMSSNPLPGAGDNTLIPTTTTIVGNEWQNSLYNLVDFPVGTFSKYNNLHDPGGYHNGFNMMTNNGYSVYDYGHDGFGNYACFYTQVGDAHGLPYEYADTLYIFNSASKDSTGIRMQGLYNGYVYNHTADDSGTNVLLGEDHIVFRKCNFTGADSSITATDGQTVGPDNYFDPVKNIYMIDSEFSHLGAAEYLIDSEVANRPSGNPTFWNINTLKTTGGVVQRPVVNIYKDNGEVRYYAYLDALVRDSSGNPVSGATITVTPLTDVNYPAINLLLPPPPPDLSAHPATNFPMPDVSTFTAVQTGADGHTPLPNYGWSANTEGSPIVMYARKVKAGTTSGYTYRITATYNSQTVYKDVTPDDTWLRRDPVQAVKTVALTFNPAGKYALTVNGGAGSGLYSAGQSVNISAGTAPSGKVFEKWIGDTTGITNVNNANTSITVPSADASITAYFKDITYHLTVNGGAGSGDYPAGKTVIVDASPTSGSQIFDRWTGTGASFVVNPAIYSSILIMPAQSVAVTANYRNSINYNCRLTVADGTGTGFYAPGDNIAVAAPNSPSVDKIFDHWDGDTATIADAGSCNTTLTNMPTAYLIIYPVYRDSGIPSNNANLSGLTISVGTLSPAFAAGVTAYTVSVGTGIVSMTITPTASQGASAAIRVNGVVVNSGSASGPISLNSGVNTVTIAVTAPDNTATRTYTVTVTRGAIGANNATAYSLAAPSPASGLVNAASGNFAVTPNGLYTGTITITPSGGGLSVPITLTFSNTSAAQTFTITPSIAGTVTLVPANNGGLADPASLTYIAYAAGTLRNASWNYPNPVNFAKADKTTIVYTVSEESNVFIGIYAITGELLKTLVNNKTESEGKYSIEWAGDTDNGEKAASGAYVYMVKIGKDIIKKKIVLLR